MTYCPHFWMGVVLLLVSPSQEQSCNPAIAYTSYTLSPSPALSDPLTGSAGAVEPPCNNNVVSITCFPGPGAKLADGDLGPVDSDYSSAGVHAWNRSAQRVMTSYQFDPLTEPIRHFNLFFYNVPSMGIGLPNIELFAGVSSTPLPYFLTGNQDISQTDNRRHNVTLSFVHTVSTKTREYRVEFDFKNTPIEWLILSEVVICNHPVIAFRPSGAPAVVTPSPSITRGVDTVSPNLTLSCSVSGEGKFLWQWTAPDGSPPNEVVLYDTTRTSTAVYTSISYSVGDSMFRCEATYDPVVPKEVVQSGFQNISVDFQFSLRVVSDSTTVMARVLDNVTLACEISGYFLPGQPQITWQAGDMAITDSTSSFSVDTMPGSTSIQNGGVTTIPSVVSELSIFVEDSSYFHNSYLCQTLSGGVAPTRVFSLEEDFSVDGGTTEEEDIGTTVPPSSAAPSPSESFFQNSTNIAIIAVAGVLVVVILLTIIAIVCLLLLRHRSANKRFTLASTNRKDSLDFTGEPFYQELRKPLPPPVPDHFPDLSPDIEAYAVVDHIRDANGGMEMQAVNNTRALPSAIVCLSTEKETSPDQHPFLEKNPLYASSDNIDDEKLAVQRRRMGSVPSLDVLTDSPTGSQLNIYANPSYVAPPVPIRPPTPELIESIYSLSESHIQPSAFKSREPMPSPTVSEDDQSLPWFSVYADPQPLLRSEGPKEVTPGNIKELKVLGVGQFGQVVLADTVGLSQRDLGLGPADNDRSATIQVAVKTLKVSAEAHVKEAFEKEIKFMSRLRNENVVRLLGICPYGDMFIIMEYMENGDLNQFLHKRKLVSVEATPRRRGLTSKQLTSICSQIASGMKYLAAFNFIHRDLATRNCLVGADLKIKIADFGMSRSLYSSDYYRISGRAMLPIRWMANECFYGKFSEKTDVWAFGVTMWEVFTFSREQPYQDMSDQEVIDDAIKGPDRLLPPRPEACPVEVYAVMEHCWIDDPQVRTGFKGAHASLVAVLESGTF